MVADQVHFISVVTHQMAKAFKARPTLGIIIGTLSGNCRNRVIVRRQFRPQVVGISDTQQPPAILLDCHAAMTKSMTERAAFLLAIESVSR